MIGRNIRSTIKAAGKYSIHGGIDQIFQNTMQDVGGLVTGFGRGLGIFGGGKLDLKNTSMLGAFTRTLGWSAGKVGATIAKPIISIGTKAVVNTPESIARWGSATGKLGRGLGKTFFKEAAEDAEYSLFGYEARMLTPHVIGLGAIGYGIANGADAEDFNMGLRTAVNGMMDTEGVATVPGSVNQTYTPLYERGRGKKINNFNADGNLTLALHNRM